MQELIVKDILDSRGISITQFAKLLKMSRPYLSNVLQGRHVNFKVLGKMSEALNVPVPQLFRYEDHRQADIESESSERGQYDVIARGISDYYTSDHLIPFSKDSMFGNMHRCKILYNGYEYESSEHLFIALRLSGHSDLQQETMDFMARRNDSLACKKLFVYGRNVLKDTTREHLDYIMSSHHPHWHDNNLDVNAMAFCLNLKYQQCEEFRKALQKTRGKGIIVEDATLRSTPDMKWGAVDVIRRDMVNRLRGKHTSMMSRLKKQMEGESGEQRERIKERIKLLEQSYKDVKTILGQMWFHFRGENIQGKLLTALRDNDGQLNYHLAYPLYLFGKEIPRSFEE